jgi:DNA-binding NarL/FixJ family response regulator
MIMKSKKPKKSKPKTTPEHALTVGLVVEDESLAARIRKALAKSELPIAFEVSPDELEDGRPPSEADVVVVAGPLQSQSDSLFSRLRGRLPEKRLVACIRHTEAPNIRWAIANGVDGVVLDTRLDQTLEPTVRAVEAGQLVVPRDLRRRMQPPELTNREKQVLSLVIMGLTNREIAQMLFLSESTVKSHLNTAFRKLGVRSRAEAGRLIADPDEGLGTGILAITGPGLARRRPPNS